MGHSRPHSWIALVPNSFVAVAEAPLSAPPRNCDLLLLPLPDPKYPNGLTGSLGGPTTFPASQYRPSHSRTANHPLILGSVPVLPLDNESS